MNALVKAAIVCLILAAAAVFGAKYAIAPAHGVAMVGPTVKIEREDGGFGSGVHIGEGFIVTAAHVLAEGVDLRVKFDDGSVCGSSACSVEVMWANQFYDIALLRIEDWRGVDTADIDCGIPPVGSPVVVVGNPLVFEFVTSYGRIGSAPQSVGWYTGEAWPVAITIDADISPGNSGGPVFNEAGALVGIVVGRVPGEALRWAVPSSVVCNLLGRTA